MGIPVITNSGVGDVAEIVNKYNAGFVLDDFSAEGLGKVVNEVVKNKQFDNREIRNGAKEFYALENAINTYRDVYASIFKTGS